MACLRWSVRVRYPPPINEDQQWFSFVILWMFYNTSTPGKQAAVIFFKVAVHQSPNVAGCFSVPSHAVSRQAIQFIFIFSEQSQCSAIFPFSILNRSNQVVVYFLDLSLGSGSSLTKLNITRSPSAMIATTDDLIESTIGCGFENFEKKSTSAFLPVAAFGLCYI